MLKIYLRQRFKNKNVTDSLNIIDELRKINSLPRQIKENFKKISNLN